MYYLIGPCTIFFPGPSHDCDTEDDIESEDFDIPANFSSSIRSLGVVSTVTLYKYLRVMTKTKPKNSEKNLVLATTKK